MKVQMSGNKLPLIFHLYHGITMKVQMFANKRLKLQSYMGDFIFESIYWLHKYIIPFARAEKVSCHLLVLHFLPVNSLFNFLCLPLFHEKNSV